MDLEKMYSLLIFFAGIVTIVMVAGIGGFAILNAFKTNHWKWKRTSAAGERLDELEDLRARVEDLERRGLVSGEVESQYARLAELEERLDFAERLLAAREPGAIEGRSS